ncbi:cysteine and histidine-rich domain-containing protein RAR1 [Vicia villosa]|uniref:cysteine and histidine-rich domain-containing protein RAR1 n=1 Tax=Vicia villosa TaxID=3911 RepID=UPI00273BB7F9|nr:cysteine and histidine-rich domain-containing protein RAR1 [Vicia villosa]
MKEWSCCKKRSHDFSLFLEIPGCKTGKHTTEKQVIAPVKKKPVPPPTAAHSTNVSTKDSSCSRCRQGFFCSDHGSQGKPVTIIGDKPLNLSGDASAESCSSVKVSKPPQKIVDINEPQICKNKGCGKTFKERDNHDSACSYHPGPAVFHDRMKGWNCCDIHVNEFDEFVAIPPCAKGWHNADQVS